MSFKLSWLPVVSGAVSSAGIDRGPRDMRRNIRHDALLVAVPRGFSGVLTVSANRELKMEKVLKEKKYQFDLQDERICRN